MDESCQIQRHQQCPLDNITCAQNIQSLETVRALHQTVVSLRTALEDAHREIDQLKKQILIHADIDQGRVYRQQYNVTQSRQTIEEENTEKNKRNETKIKLQEPVALKRNSNEPIASIISTNTGTAESIIPTDLIQNNKSKNQETDIKQHFDCTQLCKETDETETKPTTSKKTSEQDPAPSSSRKYKHSSKRIKYQLVKSPTENHAQQQTIIKQTEYFTPEINITTDQPLLTIKKSKQMASKIDVKIKVTSNVKLNELNSDTQTDTNSGSESLKDSDHSQTSDQQTDDQQKDDQQTDDQHDNQNIQIKSNENITIDQHSREFTTTKLSTENIAISEQLSTTSLSEGENSVFDDDEHNATNNQSTTTKNNVGDKKKSLEKQSTSGEHQEEVDDIELIFSSDDKEYPQEDLVSISEYEPWAKVGTSGTPILVNFSDIQSDQGNNVKKLKSPASDNDMEGPTHLDTNDQSISQDCIIQETLNMESFDSQSADIADYNKSNVDSSTKSSLNFDKGHSLDNPPNDDDQLIRRDESFDTFEQVNSTMNSASGLSKRWTNLNVLIETDISKCGIIEENGLDLSRRNTCPNPPPYRPLVHREAISQMRHTSARCPLASKYSRISGRLTIDQTGGITSRPTISAGGGALQRPILNDGNQMTNAMGPKRSSSAQTEISALPEHWRSESHLAGSRFHSGLCTLPSKFIPPPGAVMSCYRFPHLRVSDKTQEVRRALLSDINFTSMVPELSRSADHLCQDEDATNESSEVHSKKDYYKGKQLETPDYCKRGLTPSFSMTSPGVSQWTVNENSFGTQTTQTDNYWTSGVHGDSFDSSKSYSIGSKYSNQLDKSHRSRSVPSIRCAICKQNHGLGVLRISESMHYTPRVTFQEPNERSAVRGSLPDLRKECTCSTSRRYGGDGGGISGAGTGRRSMLRILGDSSGSTDSLLDEADDFLRKSMDVVAYDDEFNAKRTGCSSINTRRCSENDIKKDYTPSKQSLPFLPKSPKCLKLGHLAKVITKSDRVVIGRVRYIGPLAFNEYTEDEIFVGLQLPNKLGDCDGTIDGRKFFECEPQHGIFVPFKKIVMAWTA